MNNPSKLLLLLAAASISTSLAEAPATFRASYVAGAGDVPLSVVELGDPAAPGILFVHGLGQSHLSFSEQLNSTVAEKYHVVAFDLRGHGNSGKPSQPSAYTDSRAWADDVARVMAATHLQRPLIVSWSYGTLVMANYLRYHGGNNVSGLMMIGALGGLTPLMPGDIKPSATFTPEVMGKLSKLRESPALEDSLQGVRLAVSFLTARKMSDEWTATATAIGLLVPPYARASMVSQMKDNSDLLPTLKFPLLLMAGSEDGGTPAAVMNRLAAAAPKGASVSIYQGSGHSPFVEEPARFNAELLEFAKRTVAAR